MFAPLFARCRRVHPGFSALNTVIPESMVDRDIWLLVYVCVDTSNDGKLEAV